MLQIDPSRLARLQIESDRERTRRFPSLFEHKVSRMLASPFALLRGAAPLFYSILERHPALAKGPSGEGWLVGDAHLENFGAYRAGALKEGKERDSHSEDPVAFDLNDFDDGCVGPFRFDVLRLLTSVILAFRGLGETGPQTLGVCNALLEAYSGAAFGGARLPGAPRSVTALVLSVQKRTRHGFLDARTEVVRGKRRFPIGARYMKLESGYASKAQAALERYAKSLPKADRPSAGALEVLDVAFRVAGTGSLGSLRVAALVRGKGGLDGSWLFEMKAERQPSAEAMLAPARGREDGKLKPAERVLTAAAMCLERPPRMMGATRLGGRSMLVHRLAPQEDRLNLDGLDRAEREPVAQYCGALLGAAHRRGALRPPKRPWSMGDRARLVDRAIALAGVHEATYLAYCALVRREPGPRAAD